MQEPVIIRPRTRLVADTNILNDDYARAFLGLCDSHFLLMPDFVWMEVYKAKSIDGLRSSLSLAREFPNQVLHLKGSRRIAEIDPKPAGFGNAMIWRGADKELEKTIELLEAQPEWVVERSRAFESHVDSASQHFDLMLGFASELPQIFSDIQTIYTTHELKTIRRKGPLPLSAIEKMLDMSDYLARGLAASDKFKAKPPSRKSYCDSYITRNSISMGLYFFDWIRRGSHSELNPGRVRNDLVDRMIATYATYFNGVLTKDQRAYEAHVELRVVLEKLGARVPEQYI